MNTVSEILEPKAERSALKLIRDGFRLTLPTTLEFKVFLLVWALISAIFLEVYLKFNVFGLAKIIGVFYSSPDLVYWNTFERGLYADFIGTILAYIVGTKVMRRSAAFSAYRIVTPRMGFFVALAASFVAGTMSLMGFLFFILPGIYLVIITQFAQVIILVRDLTPIQAVKLSYTFVTSPTVQRHNGTFGENFWIAFKLSLTALCVGFGLKKLEWLFGLVWHQGFATQFVPMPFQIIESLGLIASSYFGTFIVMAIHLEFFADGLKFNPAAKSLLSAAEKQTSYSGGI